MDNLWVFGIIEKKTKKSRFFYVENKKRNTLLHINYADFHIESHMISDQWAAYATLDEHFTRYSPINHGINFVDSNDPTIYTQTVERFGLKRKHVAKTIS